MDQNEQVAEFTITQLRLKKEAHKQWLLHPVTAQLAKLLDTHESMLIDTSSEDAIRTLAAVRTVRAMRKLIFDTEHFTKLT